MLLSPSDSPSMPDVQVTVVLKPINLGHNFPRTFTLSADNPEFRIGRASKRDVKNRTAATDNGWFDSGVMSREHATFSICPEKKNIYICDTHSTHGTWLNNVRLVEGEPTPLICDDVLRFGITVDRGYEVVYPLSVSCQIEWLDNTNHGWEDRESSPSVHAAKLKTSASSKPLSNLRPSSTNTFCVPDDSDVEELQDPNINLLDEAVEGFHAAALRASQGATDPPAEDDSVNQENNPPQDKLQTSQVQHSDCIILERPDQQMDDQSDEDSDDYLDSDEDDSDLESSAPPSSGPSPFSISSNGIKGKSHKEESSVEPSDDESDPESEIESDEEPAASPREQSVNNDQVEFINPDVLMQNYPCDDTTFDQTRKIVPENSVNSTAPVTTGALKVNPEKPESVRVEVCGGVHRLHPHSVILPEEPLERLPTLESNQHTAYQHGPFACINIHDIEETATEKQTEKPAWSLKRKISEIQDAQIVDSALPATQADLDSLPKPEVVDAITSALSESEPPKKRVKTSRSTSGTVASYTATAVISALLGGLGTIALLAALPAEYFQ